jgi:cytoskeletal protein RodZ
MVADLSRPVTSEVKLSDVQGERSAPQPAQGSSKRGPLIALLALAALAGGGALIAPQLMSDPEPRQGPRLKEIPTTASSSALIKLNVDEEAPQPLQAQEPKDPTPQAEVTDTTEAPQEQTSEVNAEKAAAEKAAAEKAAAEKAAAEKAAAEKAAAEKAAAEKAAAEKAAAKKTAAKRTAKKRAKRSKARSTKRTSRKRRAPKGKGLPQSSVRQIVQQNSGSLSYCYQKIQKRDPNLGSVKTRLTFEVLPEGRTNASKVALSGKHKGSKLEKCIRMAVQRWRFPSAEGPTKVRYPLNFTMGF